MKKDFPRCYLAESDLKTLYTIPMMLILRQSGQTCWCSIWLYCKFDRQNSFIC